MAYADPDPYADVRQLAADLRAAGHAGPARLLIEAMEAGATGTEIAMSLRHHLAALLREPALDDFSDRLEEARQRLDQALQAATGRGPAPDDDTDPLDDWQAIRRRDRRKRIAIWLGGIVLAEAIAVAIAGVDGAIGASCIVLFIGGAGALRAFIRHGRDEAIENIFRGDD